MQLILWRHAEAEDTASSDLARELTANGRRQAEKMADWFTAQAGHSRSKWKMRVSPAKRTRQTAAALDLPLEIVDALAPDASCDAVLQAAGWPESDDCVIVVGHQPTLGMVAARLLGGVEGNVSMKKGAMWWFETRQRNGVMQTVLKAMASPDMV